MFLLLLLLLLLLRWRRAVMPGLGRQRQRGVGVCPENSRGVVGAQGPGVHAHPLSPSRCLLLHLDPHRLALLPHRLALHPHSLALLPYRLALLVGARRRERGGPPGGNGWGIRGRGSHRALLGYAGKACGVALVAGAGGLACACDCDCACDCACKRICTWGTCVHPIWV